MTRKQLKAIGSTLEKLDALTQGKPALRRKLRAKIKARVKEIVAKNPPHPGWAGSGRFL